MSFCAEAAVRPEDAAHSNTSKVEERNRRMFTSSSSLPSIMGHTKTEERKSVSRGAVVVAIVVRVEIAVSVEM